MFIYIFSAGALISYKAESHKHNLLMLMIGKMRNDVLKHQIKHQLFTSYITAAMPITLFIFIKLMITTNQLYFIPLFILWHGAIFTLSKIIILTYYHVAYQIFRHSFFRGAIFDILIIIGAILLYVGIHTPIMFIDPNDVPSTTFVLLGMYTLIISMMMWLGFNMYLNKYIDKNSNRIFYPLPNTSKKMKSVKYLSKQSLLLIGLSDIEKEIVIKDQKTLKRQNKKAYYGILFYGFIAVFGSARFLTTPNETFVLLDAMTEVMIAAGSYFLIHMIATAYAMSYLSYSQEGSMTNLYHRLSVSKRQVYKAKRRLFYLMTIPLIFVFILTHSFMLLQFSIDKLIIYVFSIIYLISIIRIKLHTRLHSDLNDPNIHTYDHFVQKIHVGGPLLLGLLVGVVIPVGIGWFTLEATKAFGDQFVYIMLLLITFPLILLSLFTDLYIKKSLTKKESITL